MYSKELLKGTLKTILLNLLADNKQMYGYEITQRVKELSDGKLVLTEGALYPSLHSLVADGFLTTETVKIGKRIRKYYKLTTRGNQSATEKANEFMEFADMMKLIIMPQIKTQT